MPIVRNEKVAKRTKHVANAAAGIVLGGLVGFFTIDTEIGMLTVLLGIATSSIWNLYDNS